MIDTFLPYASAGTSLVCIASLAGHNSTASKELEQHFATSATAELLEHPVIQALLAFDDHPTKEQAYGLAKRGNQLRVQYEARAWGARGARINSVSPGLISTPMIHHEIAGPNGSRVQSMVEMSCMQRKGTPEDIASVVAFLAGSEAGFITGTDVLIDGGVQTTLQWGGK